MGPTLVAEQHTRSTTRFRLEDGGRQGRGRDDFLTRDEPLLAPMPFGNELDVNIYVLIDHERGTDEV